ncbi:hypothetical protein AGMMS49992_20650 [Clostridia bacterium]|nr:hypothetical protein AGMMS49992_20650 [Clostridia bacterium]
MNDRSEASPNREYRSSVFASYFNDPARLIELYNALSGRAYSPDTPIRINTLEKALYYDRVNDLSFELDGRLIVVFEHQSTWNPNMPFRILLYIAKLFEKTYTNATPFYSTTLQKIDAVECFVLYNGIEKHSEKAVWRLSDMFKDNDTESRLELTVPVYNINDGYNSEVLRKSQSLAEYTRFINLVNHYREDGYHLRNRLTGRLMSASTMV